jgi:inorganic pyrophosphatase
MQFGISFMAPKNEWTNDFFLENELTPTQQLLNAKPIKYVSPYNAGKFEIKKQTNVPGVDYSMSSAYNYINEDGTVGTINKQLNLGKYGNNIDELMTEQYNMLNEINKINNQRYRALKAAGNTEAIQKIDAFFNKPVNNPGFN